MNNFKKLLSICVTVTLCLGNINVYAEKNIVSDKQMITDYFSGKDTLSIREQTEIIVVYSDDVSNENIANMQKTNELNNSINDIKVEKYISNNAALVKTNNLEMALETLNNDENVLFAQPNYRIYTASGEPLNDKLWAMENKCQVINGTQGTENADLNIPAAWEITSGTAETVVAVIDTGIDISHPALSESIWVNSNEQTNGTDTDNNGYIDDVSGWDFVNNDASVFDNAAIDEHGTHMAGIIAANGENGVYGVAPNIKIMSLKVMEHNSGYTSDIIEAIEYAEANGAKIANCSFAGLDYNPALEDAISKSNMLFVTAAGNYGTSTDDLVTFPACLDCKNIISVGGADNTGNISNISTFGNLIDTYVPAIGIYSTLPNNEYGFKDGTSCSAAYITGIAALLYSEYPEIRIKQIKEAICSNNTGDETELQLMNTTVNFVDAKAVLEFDFGNAKSAMPEVVYNGENTAEREPSYPFSFYDDNGIIFAINLSNEFNGKLTISSIADSQDKPTVFSSEISNTNSQVAINNIVNDTEYNFYLTYNQGITSYNYFGKLKKSYIADEDKYLTECYSIVTNNYEVEDVESPAFLNNSDDITLMSSVTEQESNNTMGLADTINSDDDVYGAISTASDVDWYKIKFSSSGVANFWLGQIPSNCDYELQLYNASGNLLKGSYEESGQAELISFYTVSANTWYYIKIYSASGYSTSQYHFRAKWYPSPDSYESNDSFAYATSLSNNGNRSANINQPDDVDFYKFTLSQNSYVELKLSNIPSGCRYHMEIYSGAGDSNFIAGIYGTGTTKEYLQILSSGTYYIRIYSYDETYSVSNYKLALTVSPVYSLSLSGSQTRSVGASEKVCHTFSISSTQGVLFNISGMTNSDYDLYLYKDLGGTWSEIAVGDSSSTTGESLSATLTSGNYVLLVQRYDGSESSYTLSTSSTTTAKDAEITVSGFPTTMTIGSIKAVTVTVKNTGVNVWTRANSYKLGGLNDVASFSDSDFLLNSSDEVQYGQSKTFSINLTAPSVTNPTNYTLNFRMKQSSSYFGDTSDNKVIQVLPEFDTITTGNTKTVSGVSKKYYKLTVSTAANYVFRTMKYSTNYDTELYLYDSAMNQIGYNDDLYEGSITRNRYSKIEKYLSAGTYYICVKPYSGSTIQCYLNVDTFTDGNISTTANISNKYEGYYKYIISTSGTFVFSTKKYSTDCDTYLVLLDSNGNVVANNNDSGSSVYAKIETDLSSGTYYIRVSSYKYITNGENIKTNCTLTVGSKSTAPSTSDSASVSIVSPINGSVIKTYTGNNVKISGNASNCSSVTVKVNNQALSGVKLSGSKFEAYYSPTVSGSYTIMVIGNAIFGSNPSDSKTVTIAVNDDNDTFTSPTAINSGTERVAAIDYSGDVDCFSFTPNETGSYKIYSSGNVDLKGVLYDNDKTTSIGTSYNAPESINFKLARTLEKNKTYYIRASAENNGTGKYSINIEKIDNPDDTDILLQWGILNVGQSYTITDATGTSRSIIGKVGSDINVLPVWEYTKGVGIKIGIVDTGTEITHSDLSGNISSTLPGYNFVYDNSTPLVSNSVHGTHVAGIAGAVGNNALGIIGVAPESQIVVMPVLEMPNDPSMPKNNDIDVAFIDAINYAVDNNIDILNCSFEMWGYPEASMIELKNTIKNASNILFVCAAGNNSLNLAGNSTYYPVSFDTDNMIVVAAINSDGKFADTYSNYGGPTDIAAPGTAIYSTVLGNAYDYLTGTSMAAPHVSGTAALIKSYYSDLSVAQIKQRIISSNNVSYNAGLSGKVSSSGTLNAWNSFCNDSSTPRSFMQTNEEIDTKASILEHMNNADDEQLTSKLYVNIGEGYTQNDIVELIGSQANVIKENKLTGSFLIEYSSVENMKNAVIFLNALSEVIYAEPVYKVFANATRR